MSFLNKELEDDIEHTEKLMIEQDESTIEKSRPGRRAERLVNSASRIGYILTISKWRPSAVSTHVGL